MSDYPYTEKDAELARQIAADGPMLRTLLKLAQHGPGEAWVAHDLARSLRHVHGITQQCLHGALNERLVVFDDRGESRWWRHLWTMTRRGRAITELAGTLAAVSQAAQDQLDGR